MPLVKLSLRLNRALSAVNEAIGVSARNVAGILLAVMTAIVMAQIISRYGLNSSLSWTEELSKTLMVWSAFLVAPWAYRHGANVTIDIFADALPPVIGRLANLVITLLVMWILAVFFVESLGFVARGMQVRAASLPVQSGIFYLITPASFAAMFLVGIEQLIKDLLALLGHEEPENDPEMRREA